MRDRRHDTEVDLVLESRQGQVVGIEVKASCTARLSHPPGTMTGVAKPVRPDALPDSYLSTLEELKAVVRAAQVKARVVVNTEMIRLYWQIGRTIVDRQAVHGWGGKVIERLAKDLRAEFPTIRGFSRSNLELHAATGARVAKCIPPTACWGNAVGAHHRAPRQGRAG